MELHLKTLTPIWTGDYNAKCDALKMTGLAGSIRWWYEAMIRGLGGWACDPTGKSDRIEKCSYQSLDDPQNKTEKKLDLMILNGLIQEAHRKDYANKAGFYTLDRGTLKPCVCEACKLFGCNGWAKTFRIRVADVKLTPEHHKEHSKKNLITINGNKGYMVPFGLVGNFTLRISPIGIRDPEADRKVLVALQLALKYGALGAKTHLGYGVLKCREGKSILPENFDIETTVNAIVRNFSSNASPAHLNDNVPVLTDFIFARLHPQNNSMPVSAPLQWRYKWRDKLRSGSAYNCTNQEITYLRHYFAGTTSYPNCKEKKCKTMLTLSSRKGLTAIQTIHKLGKISKARSYKFKNYKIEQIIDEVLTIADLDRVRYCFDIEEDMPKNSLIDFVENKMRMDFCPRCNQPKPYGHFKKNGKIASHHFASRKYTNDKDTVEIRSWAWFPAVLDKFFPQARQATRDAFVGFVTKEGNADQIEYYDGQEPAQWLKDLLNE